MFMIPIIVGIILIIMVASICTNSYEIKKIKKELEDLKKELKK